MKKKQESREQLLLKELGKSFQERREALGWNFTDVRERSGINKITLSKLERGLLENVSLTTISKIAEALDMRITIVLNHK